MVEVLDGTAYSDRLHKFGNQFNLTVGIENTGTHTANYEVRTTITTGDGQKLHPRSRKLSLRPGQVYNVHMSFHGNTKDAGEWRVNVGEWTVDIEVRSAHGINGEILHQRTETIHVVEGPLPTATPIATPTPEPITTPALKGRIDSARAAFYKGTFGNYFVIPVHNTGYDEGKFLLKGHARSEESGTGYVIESISHLVDPNKTKLFLLEVDVYETGIWKLDVNLYSEMDHATALDSEAITIMVERRPPTPTRITRTPTVDPAPLLN